MYVCFVSCRNQVTSLYDQALQALDLDTPVLIPHQHFPKTPGRDVHIISNEVDEDTGVFSFFVCSTGPDSISMFINIIGTA